jgi:dTDP-4-amino-4,6-dideoxygalactose transaminase
MSDRPTIPFNKPFLTGRELDYIAEAHRNGHLAGNGQFSKRCAAWLEERIGSTKALLTHSCTGALEMSAILAEVGPGDEVIMPSFTFVSTANAFVLRGATPVFVDIRPDTLNLDETLIEAAITPRTKAIVPVHYAGVGCAMDAIQAIAERHGLVVIEDAAQGLLAAIDGRPLGGIGHLAALSFHETKNIISGEGGALLINDTRFAERAEIIWEKGTNRAQFFRGQVDKYTWVDVGSSFLPGEITAAFLWAQMEQAEAITERRLAIWARYHEAFAPLEAAGFVQRPVVPPDSRPNGHMYQLLLPDLASRTRFIDELKAHDIHPVFHYVPLHDSPYGRAVGRAAGDLPWTRSVSDRLVRMPFWLGLEEHLDDVLEIADATIRRIGAQLAPPSPAAPAVSSRTS